MLPSDMLRYVMELSIKDEAYGNLNINKYQRKASC